MTNEIYFEVKEDNVDGGYNATALGVGIHTQGETVDEVRKNILEAVSCYYDEGMVPKIVRLHFVRDEVLCP